MSEKTEGSFKIQTKPKLTAEQIAAKNKEPLVDVPSNVTRVVIPNEEPAAADPAADAIVDPPIDPPIEPVIKEVTNNEPTKPVPPVNTPAPAAVLPENVTKLVDFMRETGGTLQDYVRLNTNYDDVDRDVLVKEYYKNTKAHLSADEIDFMIDDNFAFDEE